MKIKRPALVTRCRYIDKRNLFTDFQSHLSAIDTRVGCGTKPRLNTTQRDTQANCNDDIDPAFVSLPVPALQQSHLPLPFPPHPRPKPPVSGTRPCGLPSVGGHSDSDTGLPNRLHYTPSVTHVTHNHYFLVPDNREQCPNSFTDTAIQIIGCFSIYLLELDFVRLRS
ncbi:hypothetical protein J6590_072401 [Homalodisca vitripennis]|nr:hypothetical protein J6590_072401 [Homalodisca vitripennis]